MNNSHQYPTTTTGGFSKADADGPLLDRYFYVEYDCNYYRGEQQYSIIDDKLKNGKWVPYGYERRKILRDGVYCAGPLGKGK